MTDWETAWAKLAEELSGNEFYATVDQPAEGSALQEGWSYGVRLTDDETTWWTKAPDGEWERIAADSPEALAFRSMFHRPVVIDDFSGGIP